MTTDEGSGTPGGPGGDLEPFLREAPAVIAEAAASVEALGGAGADVALGSLAALSHRLYGSSALYGLGDLAAIAEAMERAVAGLARDGGAAAGRGRSVLREAVAALEDGLAAARDGRRDGAEAIPAGLLARLAELSASNDPLAARLRAVAAASPDVLEFFAPEAREQVEGIADALGRIAGGRAARLPVESAFRFAHTLKGAAYMVECEPIGRLAHAIEEVLAAAAAGDGRLELHGPALAALEDATGLALRMVAALAGEPDELTAAEGEIHARLASLLPAIVEPGVATPPAEAEAEAAAGPRPASAEGVSEQRLAAAVASAVTSSPPAADDRAAGRERTIRVGLERIDLLVDQVGEAMISRGRLEHEVGRIAEVERLFAASRDRLARAAEDLEHRRLDSDADADEGEDAPERTEHNRAEFAEISLAGFSELELDRYDRADVLRRQIAEIAFDIGESLSQLGALRRNLDTEVGRAGRLLRDLRSTIGRTRMLPFGRQFERFRQQVERVARDDDKLVDVEVVGQRVEADALIVQRITDPLLHLVTNAVVHGIEPRDERLAAGKPERGRVSLRAAVHGAYVDLEVEDDGRGLDPEALRERAEALGFATGGQAAAMSEAEVLEQVFLPGFSTAHEVSGSAGRGIGLDVVRAVAGELGGQVRLETEPGVGTRFTLRLPASLVVSTALRIRVGTATFVLPTLYVRRLLHLGSDRLESGAGRTWTVVEGDRVEVVQLARHLGLRGTTRPGAAAPLVVVRTPGRSVALAVDELMGVEEVVVQGLGGFLDGLAGYSGVTIDTDGGVVLVLDPASLLAVAPADAAESAATAEAGTAREAARRRVLVADDSISVRKVLGRQLGAAGYEVVTAQDGEEALKLLRERRFAALITDIEMPRLNGFELLDVIRRRPATRALPVIIVTTRTGAKHRELADRLGVAAYFSKPVDFEALFARLAQLTARRRPGAPAGAPGTTTLEAR